MRTITSHQINPDNDRLISEVLDEPGSGGAHHLYKVSGFSTKTNPSDVFASYYGRAAETAHVLFQQGPIAEAGVNGLTHEALLAILIDRLACFQAGPYACAENQSALEHLQAGQEALLSRTRARMARGVEGTHQA